MKLHDLGEFGFIDRIAAAIAEKTTVKIGIGDDAAAVEPTPGHLTLMTSDMLIEGVHFDLNLSDPLTLGRKSLAVNLSDLAAMGAKPRYYLLSLAIPQRLDLEFLDKFVSGMMQRADQFGVTLIGGDTCSSKGGLAISVTAIGEQLPQLVVQRSGARPGDLIFVTGTIGDSALGLELLRHGEKIGPLISRHLDPEPRLSAGIALAEAGLATAMIDISDGLLADLGHILEKSAVGARMDLTGLPISDQYRKEITRFSEDCFSLALGGGEDYELVFTAPVLLKDRVFSCMEACGVNVSIIGEITAENRLAITAADGSLYQPRRQGYNHFA
ncbi:thiamine-phosphate kinase [Geotalea toluenoxydans]